MGEIVCVWQAIEKDSFKLHCLLSVEKKPSNKILKHQTKNQATKN